MDAQASILAGLQASGIIVSIVTTPSLTAWSRSWSLAR